MSSPSIRVKIEGFRAVNKADIVIDGITVVAGENGSGKSSVSKLLYFLYKTVSNYDALVTNKLYSDLRSVLRFLDILNRELSFSPKDRENKRSFRNELSDLRRSLLQAEYLDEELEKWISILNYYEDLYIKSISEITIEKKHNRLKHIMKDLLNIEESDDDFVKYFSLLKDLVGSKFKEAIGKIKSRPNSVFIEELINVFTEDDLPKKFDVLEFDEKIVSLKSNHLSIPYSIQNAIYIDTPMMLSIEDSENIYWDDLNELLSQKGSATNILSQEINDNIINGKAVVEEGVYEEIFKFKREDGAVFNLLDVATGIKAFSIIQLLINNGVLNDKTLLIIDEPESNLHPQWIIEYARLIVLLNKKYKIKFFIASHNPDMISAIRYISEKEGNLDKVNFYISEKSDNKYSYNYTFLDKDIEPIFESFNIAIDKISKYGI